MLNCFKESFNQLLSLKKILDNYQFTISTAESCTGGLLGAFFTSIPGSSSFFQSSVVVYSNYQKINILNIDKNIIKNYGAVSEECAYLMAKAVKEITKTNIAISTTGIAGPDGATYNKPVGTVYSSIIINEAVENYHFLFKGERNQIRILTVQTILKELEKLLNKK